jgi:hypothetical protein
MGFEVVVIIEVVSIPSTQAASGVLSCFSGGLQGAYFILFYFILFYFILL